MSLKSEAGRSTSATHRQSDQLTMQAVQRDRARAETVRTLLRQIPAALGASLICAGLVAFAVWDSVPRAPLIAWAVLIAASTIGRFWLWYRTQGRATPLAWRAHVRWGLLAGAALGGVLWGAIGAYVILTSSSDWGVLLIGFVSAGIGAGAAAGLSGYPPVFYSSMLPNLLPCAAAMFVRGDSPYPVLGAMVLVFAAALAYFSRNVHHAMVKSTALHFENLDLITDLGNAREAAEALVVERTQALSQANRDLERRVRESARAELALSEAAAQLRLITENLPVYISLFGPDYRYRFANAKYRSSFSRGPEEIVGRHVADVIGHDHFEEVRPHFERRLRVTFVPQAGESGPGTSILSLIVDLTEEREREQALRESEERLRRVIQNMPVMMYALDADGSIIVWNRECERVTGFDAEQIVGRLDAFDHLFPDPVYRDEMRRTIFAHEDFRDWEARVACADGSVRTVSWFNISGSFPIPGWASWGMGVDVSDRARGRESLEQALARERELSELKSRFVAMASHEFRTPLTSIQASVDLLRHYGARMSDEQKLENLRGISREIVAVTALLEDILTLGKADAGRTEFHPVVLDLRALCLDQIEKARLIAKPEHEFKFDWAGNCAAVFADEQLLLHILTNALSNAVKYSPNGGLIVLTLRCGEHDLRLSVSDRGIGIPAEGRERIFDAFHRFANVGTISGTGLGLAIMKRAAERHGGMVGIESEEGVGTTVIAVLPVVPPETGEPASAGPADSDQVQPK